VTSSWSFIHQYAPIFVVSRPPHDWATSRWFRTACWLLAQTKILQHVFAMKAAVLT